MEKVLVVGASGLVGKALCRELSDKYKVYGTYNNNTVHIDNVDMIKFQIEDSEKIIDVLESCTPDKIIISLNGDYEKQYETIRKIGEYSKNNDSVIYFVSTWNVFDSSPFKVYYENDLRRSDTDYGNFKINAEDFLLSIVKDRCVIFRLPMIWGKESKRFNKLRSDLCSNKRVEVIPNMFLNHNSDEFLAKQIKYIMGECSSGIFHMGSVDEINHYDFLRRIIEKLGYKDVEFEETELAYGRLTATLGAYFKMPKALEVSNEDVINSLF